jgi:hypothetical protein
MVSPIVPQSPRQRQNNLSHPAGELKPGDRIVGLDPRESVAVTALRLTGRQEKPRNLAVSHSLTDPSHRYVTTRGVPHRWLPSKTLVGTALHRMAGNRRIWHDCLELRMLYDTMQFPTKH